MHDPDYEGVTSEYTQYQGLRDTKAVFLGHQLQETLAHAANISNAESI